MKASLFVYTRTYYTDFHVLYKPIGHEECLMEYTELAEKLVAQYDVNKETQPHWVYLNFNSSILWGVVCANSCLGNKFSDKASRPVRGFFGIVVSIEKGTHFSLPNDLAFFTDLYKQNVDQVWETRNYNSFECEFELEGLSNNTSFDVVKEIDSLRTLKNYVVMADVDEYCEFLGKRNDEKRKKREAEVERLRQEEEREREEKERKAKFEKWETEYNKCSSIEDFRRYANEHAGEYDNPYLQKAKNNSHVQETANNHSIHTNDNDFLTVIVKCASTIVMVIAVLWIWGGLSAPKKPHPSPGFIYCSYCNGTGYNYKLLWGFFSSKCSACWGSGYAPQITPSMPERIDPTTFGQSELQYKGKKCGIIMDDGKFCRCPGCEPGHWDPFICTKCPHKSKDHNR